MPLLPDDERLLRRALALARGAAAFASPNPAVGCVLARGDAVLGEGAHRYDLRDHAEVVALKHAAELGHDVRGATAYVTLEPCSHHGRTGPCADALIASGIARCVVATADPNPLVRRAGLGRLRRGGVEVVLVDPTQPLAQEARRLNDAFAFSIQSGRPFVTLKSAVSADGRLAPAPTARTGGAPHWITGPAARDDVQALRHRSDVLLTGIGTVLADDPELTDRTGQPRRRPLLRVVLDSDLRTPPESKLVRSAAGDLVLAASVRADPQRERALVERGAEVIRIPDAPPAERGGGGGAKLRFLFSVFPQHRAMRSVLVEGGSALNGSLLAEGLVDELILYTGPLKLGPGALPFAVGQPDPAAWVARLTGVSRTAFQHGPGEDIRTCGYLHDPWAGIDNPAAEVIVMPRRP